MHAIIDNISTARKPGRRRLEPRSAQRQRLQVQRRRTCAGRTHLGTPGPADAGMLDYVLSHDGKPQISAHFAREASRLSYCHLESARRRGHAHLQIGLCVTDLTTQLARGASRAEGAPRPLTVVRRQRSRDLAASRFPGCPSEISRDLAALKTPDGPLGPRG